MANVLLITNDFQKRNIQFNIVVKCIFIARLEFSFLHISSRMGQIMYFK